MDISKLSLLLIYAKNDKIHNFVSWTEWLGERNNQLVSIFAICDLKYHLVQ